jgi:hypothetical protein
MRRRFGKRRCRLGELLFMRKPISLPAFFMPEIRRRNGERMRRSLIRILVIIVTRFVDCRLQRIRGKRRGQSKIRRRYLIFQNAARLSRGSENRRRLAPLFSIEKL